MRPDELIIFDSNRSNILSGIRNLVLALVSPYVSFAGPLWGATTVSISERYKNGRESMDSIFSGFGTFRWSTALGVMLYPVVYFVRPILDLSIGLSLMIQGFVCMRLGVGTCKTPIEMSIASVSGIILATKGAAWGMAVGIILILLLRDYGKAENKDEDIKA